MFKKFAKLTGIVVATSFVFMANVGVVLADGSPYSPYSPYGGHKPVDTGLVGVQDIFVIAGVILYIAGSTLLFSTKHLQNKLD